MGEHRTFGARDRALSSILPASMSVRGSLRTMSIEDVLTWLSRRLACGTLTLEHKSVVRTFICDAGYIAGAGSNQPHEELGRMLLARGLVNESSMAEARQVQADTGVPLGRILSMVGKVTEERLRALLEELAMQAMLDVFSWEEGTFAFEPATEALEAAELPIAVQLHVCLDEGRHQAVRWKAIREQLPSDNIVLRVANQEAYQAAVAAAGPVQARDLESIVGAIGRGRSIEQLTVELGIARRTLFEHLSALLDSGVVALPGALALGPDASVEDLAAEAQRLAVAGERGDAFELAQRARSLAPDDQALESLYRTTERALFAELSRQLLTSFRVPALLIKPNQIDSLELSEPERVLVSRVDGRWDLLSLMRSSPLREAEALITFKRLADRGIISL